jgi:hypothetical protein
MFANQQTAAPDEISLEKQDRPGSHRPREGLMQVFYASPWVPPEWIKAHGLEPRGVWLAGNSSPLPLAAGVCAFAESVVRLAETNPGSAMIFSTHCDQLRRGFDVAADAAAERIFLFNLPATWQTAVAGRMFASELQRLSRFLVAVGGQPPNAEGLSKTMAEYCLARAQLLEAAAHLPARQYCEAVARFHWDGSINLGEDVRRPEADAIPLAVVGGPLPAWQGHVLDAIESAGGRVVLNATEAGERCLGPALSPEQAPSAAGTLSDLLCLLTRTFLDNCVDVFQRPNTRLYDWLRVRLAARKVRGIVLWRYVGCDLWRAEAQPLREAFSLPVLLLDVHEAAGDASRQSGRIQAFLESLK